MESLFALLADTASQRAEQPLFIRGQQTSSYGEIARDADVLAGALAEMGVRKGDRVVLLAENVPEYVTAYYGCLRAGAVVVPLCTDTRPAALQRCIDHCEAKVAITGPRPTAMLGEVAANTPSLRAVISIGKSATQWPAQISGHAMDDVLAHGKPSDSRGSDAQGDDLAAIMYTSGTTAEPKGVMLTHKNLLSNTRSIVEYLRLCDDERIGLVLPLYYSYGNSIMHTHVCVGGALVALGSIAFPAVVLNGISQHRCTGFSGVPSTFARLVRSSLIETTDLSSLRYLTQAGGPMSPQLTLEVRRAIPTAKLFVMYGQTEAAPRLSYLPPEDLDRKLGSAGIAIPGVSLDVMDDAGTSVAPDTVGELVARGDNIMIGYWRDEATTAQVLRSEGLRTGDLARRDGDGYIFIVGRKGELIKTGAHRVSPSEIEQAIEQLEGVADCAVVGRPDEMLGEAIVAFVVARPDSPLDDVRVGRWCFEQLPRFKQPAEIRLVPSLPRTPAGKLQRGELRREAARGPQPAPHAK